MLVRKVSFTPYLLLTARERNKGGTADNVYSSLVILFRLRGIFYCLAFTCANVVKKSQTCFVAKGYEQYRKERVCYENTACARKRK